tara:strand:+ start:2123 stop:3073 length:951 start_codon:yes stop_codon:yes gene_type:complete
MINTTKNENINWLINAFVDSNFLLSLNPVIAGSFVSNIYKTCSIYDTDSKFRQLKNKLEKGIKTVDLDKFGDIDIWMLNNNEIHNELNINRNITSDSPPNRIQPHNDGATFSLKSTSKWANTYYLNRNIHDKNKIVSTYGTNTFQFIKTKHESPSELLKTFDFINSSVAWHDGVTYYDSRIDSAFENLELQMNSMSGYENSSIATKVFNGLRAFKYSKRYGLHFSEELTDKVFNVYCESVDVDFNKYNEKVVELENLYGKKISSSDALKSMISSFHRCFGIFITMKYFKPEYAAFLINSSDQLYNLKDYLNKDIPF